MSPSCRRGWPPAQCPCRRSRPAPRRRRRAPGPPSTLCTTSCGRRVDLAQLVVAPGDHQQRGVVLRERHGGGEAGRGGEAAHVDLGLDGVRRQVDRRDGAPGLGDRALCGHPGHVAGRGSPVRRCAGRRDTRRQGEEKRDAREEDGRAIRPRHAGRPVRAERGATGSAGSAGTGGVSTTGAGRPGRAVAVAPSRGLPHRPEVPGDRVLLVGHRRGRAARRGRAGRRAGRRHRRPRSPARSWPARHRGWRCGRPAARRPAPSASPSGPTPSRRSR